MRVHEGLAALLTAGLLLATSAMAQTQSVTENGESFRRTVDAYGQRYELIGSGVFTYMIWTAYAGAYYQGEGETDPRPLDDIPRRLELAYFHAIDAEDFAEATRETLEKNLTLYEFNQVKDDVDVINDSYRSVSPGDRYILSWDGSQLRLALNDEVVYTGDSVETASAMFGIWLGERPLGDGFRDALLGQR